MRLTNQQFIDKANYIHNNKYNYSKIKYKNTQAKIIIICKKHKEFLQSPNSHLSGSGCPKCKLEKIRLSNQEFINKANKIHNFKYDYSKIDYINNKTKIVIICPKHGRFKQIPFNHLKNIGCRKCSSKYINTELFVKKAKKLYQNKYNYSKSIYVDTFTPIIIICYKHGEFKQTARNHLRGSECTFCHRPISKKFTTQEFIKKAQKVHDSKYDYSKVDYINNKTKIIIICKKHGDFLQNPNNHLRNTNCPKCKHIISKTGTKWLDQIEKEDNIKLEREYYLNIDNQQFFIDGFNLKTKTCYEYYGNYWHGNPDIYNLKDFNKSTKTTFEELYKKTLKKEQIIKSAGYNLIVKWEN